ncbi:hypothetical protein [Undibacterium sp.]|uniref:hypothetical protein n=1 Tax=Undibacterium sp. TaxID=1914977 RepID=UPI002731B87E|nr:hypothetical protein [Undibacterium sp.]MDP1979153.1 hypothetical protein [Undibacterium sp.]
MHSTPKREEIRQIYRELNQNARSLLVERIDLATLTLKDIGPDAIRCAMAWRLAYSATNAHKMPGWDWHLEWKKARGRPRLVQLAIWDEQKLYALAIGRVSKGRINATLHFIEADPWKDSNLPKAGKIFARYLEAVGYLARCREIILDRPNKNLIEYYKELGFTELHKAKGEKGREYLKWVLNDNYAA